MSMRRPATPAPPVVASLGDAADEEVVVGLALVLVAFALVLVAIDNEVVVGAGVDDAGADEAAEETVAPPMGAVDWPSI